MDADAFRAEFPVLQNRAYLNAGTNGPTPRRSAEAARARLESEVERGRSGAAYSRELAQLVESLRARLAALLNATADEVAVTRSTTDGVNLVLGGLDLGSGDEVLTSDQEHPGLLAPLAALRRRVGVAIRVAPFHRLAEGLERKTRLIAVSHVSWMSGALAPIEELRESGVPLLIDGAQGLGAVPVDVRALDCDFYAAGGQKWLCGPNGVGALFVREQCIPRLGMPWPSYATLEDPERPLDLAPRLGARRFDGGSVPAPTAAAALESIRLLQEPGWPWIFERARTQAERLRRLLSAKAEVIPGGASTLVSWRTDDAVEAVEQLAAQAVVVRSLPERLWLRASVGAWNSDEDLERLVGAL